MEKRKLNALIVVRLSRLMDESTAPQRQEKECRELCDRLGYTVLGVASDLNVSAGATTPFERPELSQWIGDGVNNPGRCYEIDVIVFWRLDRIVRSMNQLHDLMRWCDSFDISLKSATEAHIDTTTDMGKIMATLVGSFAQVELEAIRERIGADQHHRLVTGKYRGSLPSWGYMPKQTKDGWVVVPDPEQVAQIERAVNMVLDGVSLNKVALVFNADGEITPRDRNDIRQGRKPKGREWRGNRMKAQLLSKAMLGYVVVRDPVLDKNGKPKRDKRGGKIYGEPRVAIGGDGLPVKRAEAVIPPDVHKRLCEVIESRGHTPRARSESLLLHVIHCGVCGRPAYGMNAGKGRTPTYRCSSAQAHSTGGKCSPNKLQVSKPAMDEMATTQFLHLFGDSQRAVKRWDSGVDNSVEIDNLEETIKALAKQLNLYRPDTVAFRAIADNMKSLQVQVDKLASEGNRPAGWVWEPTGETVREWWESATVPERNQYLQDCGFRMTYKHRPESKPGELPSVHFEIDLSGGVADLIAGDTLSMLRGRVGAVPKGHTLEIDVAKQAKIMERVSHG